MAEELKERILQRLEEAGETPVSGQALAAAFGVTRAAVWKAVGALRAEGNVIEAGTNRGYVLTREADALTEAGVRRRLGARFEHMELGVFETIDSTNTEARRRIETGGPREMLLCANEQTAGRGRRGNSFYSPARTGLYMTAVFCPHAQLQDTLRTTLAAAVAVCEAVEQLGGPRPQIKWVNDIFVNGRKVCGILTEAVSDFESGTAEAILVGIGINVTTADFPAQLRDTASSLALPSLRREDLAAAVAQRLFALLDADDPAALLEAYRARSLVLGRDIAFTQNGREIRAHVDGINDAGNLLVTAENGEPMVLRSGEISLGSASFAGK